MSFDWKHWTTSSWWLNHPNTKICSSNWWIFSGRLWFFSIWKVPDGTVDERNLICRLSSYPIIYRVCTSQVVQDFFHQQYCSQIQRSVESLKVELSIWIIQERHVFSNEHIAHDLAPLYKQCTYPPKTNMTSWKITMFNRKYIFIHGGCSS